MLVPSYDPAQVVTYLMRYGCNHRIVYLPGHEVQTGKQDFKVRENESPRAILRILSSSSIDKHSPTW